jgi:hypothetical protein
MSASGAIAEGKSFPRLVPLAACLSCAHFCTPIVKIPSSSYKIRVLTPTIISVTTYLDEIAWIVLPADWVIVRGAVVLHSIGGSST